MKWSLFFFMFLGSFCYSNPKIYDCFLFFNELELLEIRLNEMYDYVDYFVLLEANETFQGKPKQLHYRRNQHLFSKYADKIIYVPVTNRIDGDHWYREHYQRSQLKRGLHSCSPEDIILLSDLDEIIRGTDVQRLVAPILMNQEMAVTSRMRFYRCYFNRRDIPWMFWHGTVATKYRNVQNESLQSLRDRKDYFLKIDDSGWHFSSVGGLSKYLTKLDSFSHPESNTSENRDPVNIYNFIQTNLQLVPIDESFPKLIQERYSEYLRMGFIDYDGNQLYK